MYGASADSPARRNPGDLRGGVSIDIEEEEEEEEEEHLADISRLRLGQLVRGVFKILLAAPDGLPARDVLARLKAEVPPTEFENADYPNRPNVRRREKTVRFATIPFVKAGWLRKDKGTWWITEEGRAAYDKFTDPASFVREAVALYQAWKANQTPMTVPDEAVEEEAVETSSIR